MEIYGLTGVLLADNRNTLRLRIAEGDDGYAEETFTLSERPKPFEDPFSFFAAVVRNSVELKPYDLSSLENNMLVVEILDAAKQSANTKRTIVLKQ